MAPCGAFMSDAKVTFLTFDGEPAEFGKEVYFEFKCPKHPVNRCGGLIIRGRGRDIPQRTWMWDGNRKAPTFSPSINCRSCPGKWHGYIESGRCVNAQKQDEPESE
jgi:hypothetical protein